MPVISNQILYLVSFILAFCSILYELLIAQAISFLAHNTVIWYSLTIGLYLAAMGLGSLCVTRFLKNRQPQYFLFYLEIGLSIIGALCVALVYFSHMISSYLWAKNLFLFGFFEFVAVAFILVAGIGFMTGMEVPLLIRLIHKDEDKKSSINLILVVDYLGSLVAALIFPLVLIPKLELITIGLLVSLCNIGVALFIFWKMRFSSMFGRILSWSIMFGLVFCVCYQQSIQEYFLKQYYYSDYSNKKFLDIFPPVKTDLSVLRVQSPYQKIDLVQVPPLPGPYQKLIEVYSNKYKSDFSFPKDYILYLDGNFQLWSNFEEVYHEYFAHVPIIFQNEIPKKILILGAGDGLLVRELLKYNQIESIDWVELDKKMIDLAQNNSVLVEMNKDVFDDKRINLVIGDGYAFVRNTNKMYDAVYIDFPSPNNYNLSKLYSYEFYSLVKDNLNEGGFLVLDAPEGGLVDSKSNLLMTRDQDIYYQTLKRAGFKTVQSYFSNLETDHKVAQKILWEFLENTQGITVLESGVGNTNAVQIHGKHAIAQKLLEDFVRDYRQRFFFVKKNSSAINKVYRDFGIPLNILNSERFLLSFENPAVQKSVYEKHINTIFRPTLPDLSYFWRLKSPY